MFSRRGATGRGSAGHDQKLPSFGHQLDRAKKGEAEALSILYRQFLPGIFGYIAARIPDRVTAEDLTSDVFLKMVEGIHQVRADNEAGFVAWLLQIARMTIAGYYRKREKQPIFVSFEPASSEEENENSNVIPASHPDTDPVRCFETRDEWNTVVRGINMLTEEQRQVLVGRLILGYDVETVAKMIGKKANAVKALQFRALQSLQRFLKKSALPEETFYTYIQHQEKIR